jgi:epoxide hydrolase-like predicted phosphatase
MIKAVLFDFGGVLSEEGKTGFVARTIAELYGLRPEQVRIFDLHSKLRRGLISDAEFFKTLNRRLGGSVTKQQFLQKADYPTLSKEVYDLAASLRAHGIKTGILSNIFSMNAQELRKEGCYKGFDPVILSCDEGYAKPDPEFYQIALQKLQVNPNEVLFIDDQEKCLAPARELGMHTLLAHSSQQIAAGTRKVIARENKQQV